MEQSQKPQDHHIVAGGEEVPVTIAGRSLRAFVRQVRPTELDDYLRAEEQGEEAVLAMTTTVEGQSVDPDALSLEDWEALVAADERQNFTYARAREKRVAARAERQLAQLRAANPDLYKRLQAKQETAMESLISSLEPSAAESPDGQRPAQ
jgi:hypothetical protein